jgi:hypothetical protein
MEPAHDNSNVIRDVFDALRSSNMGRARQTIKDQYEFQIVTPSSRKYTKIESLKTFMRDGFIDRYSPSSQRLIFPGVMRLISHFMPDLFPFDSHWKMSECHIAYWELMPTIDHLVPVARGGADAESNWITTSQIRNSAKGAWTLDELGWKVQPEGKLAEWDGLMGWFVEYYDGNPPLASQPHLRAWREAIAACSGHLANEPG